MIAAGHTSHVDAGKSPPSPFESPSSSFLNSNNVYTIRNPSLKPSEAFVTESPCPLLLSPAQTPSENRAPRVPLSTTALVASLKPTLTKIIAVIEAFLSHKDRTNEDWPHHSKYLTLEENFSAALWVKILRRSLLGNDTIRAAPTFSPTWPDFCRIN